MTKTRVSIMAALALVLIVAGAVSAQSFPRSPMDWVIAKRLTVNTTSTLTGAVTTGGDVAVGNDLTVAGDAEATGLALTGDLNLMAQTVLTVTGNSTIVPAGSYQPIAAAGAVGTSAIQAGTAGDLLVLVNVGSNTITLTDTGTLKLSGNAALGQFDNVTLLSDGTNWIEVSETNN